MCAVGVSMFAGNGTSVKTQGGLLAVPSKRKVVMLWLAVHTPDTTKTNVYVPPPLAPPRLVKSLFVSFWEITEAEIHICSNEMCKTLGSVGQCDDSGWV